MFGSVYKIPTAIPIIQDVAQKDFKMCDPLGQKASSYQQSQMSSILATGRLWPLSTCSLSWIEIYSKCNIYMLDCENVVRREECETSDGYFCIDRKYVAVIMF